MYTPSRTHIEKRLERMKYKRMFIFCIHKHIIERTRKKRHQNKEVTNVYTNKPESNTHANLQ